MKEWLIIFAALWTGVVIGWLTKPPWFSKEYRKWEEENARIRKWIIKQEEKNDTP